MSKKKKEWRAEKERLLSLGQEERRKDYRGNFLPLEKVKTWADQNDSTATEKNEGNSSSLAHKVSLHKGDITILEVDAIVNAANSSLLGGGGVDGCIHRAAGHLLYEECQSLNGCDTGKAKITCGYDLPAKYVIHTVGPIARGNVGQSQRDDLESCYKNSLKLVKEHNLRSVAFPCISTGIYGFPNEPAADIALKTVRDWILSNKDEIDCVIFCVFLETDYDIYYRKMSDFFSSDNDSDEKEEEEKMEEGNTQTEAGEEEDASQDDKLDEEMHSQPVKCEDEEMDSQKPDDKPADQDIKTEETPAPEPQKQEKEIPQKGDPEVKDSPEAERKPKEKTDEEKAGKKTEEQCGEPGAAGDERGSSPAKKKQTAQTDEEENQRKDPVKADDSMKEADEGSQVPMEVQEADASEIKPDKEKGTSSAKDEMRAQDKSPQEAESTSTDSSQSKDGQVDKSAPKKE